MVCFETFSASSMPTLEITLMQVQVQLKVDIQFKPLRPGIIYILQIYLNCLIQNVLYCTSRLSHFISIQYLCILYDDIITSSSSNEINLKNIKEFGQASLDYGLG